MYEHLTLSSLLVDLPGYRVRLCCALDKLRAVCIYLGITSAAGHMPHVTMILFKMRLFELYKVIRASQLVFLASVFQFRFSSEINYLEKTYLPFFIVAACVLIYSLLS